MRGGGVSEFLHWVDPAQQLVDGNVENIGNAPQRRQVGLDVTFFPVRNFALRGVQFVRKLRLRQARVFPQGSKIGRKFNFHNLHYRQKKTKTLDLDSFCLYNVKKKYCIFFL